jgi:hypothetical protein
MDKYNPVAPQLTGGAYRPANKYSFGSLEGYLDAKLFLAILEKAGKELSRSSFYSAAEGLTKFDIGLGAPIELSKTRHQALDKVWFTYATPEGWKSTVDPASVLKR